MSAATSEPRGGAADAPTRRRLATRPRRRLATAASPRLRSRRRRRMSRAASEDVSSSHRSSSADRSARDRESAARNRTDSSTNVSTRASNAAAWSVAVACAGTKRVDRPPSTLFGERRGPAVGSRARRRREQRRELRLRRVERGVQARPVVAALHEDDEPRVVRDGAHAFDVREGDLLLQGAQARRVLGDDASHLVDVSQSDVVRFPRVVEIALGLLRRRDDGVRPQDLELVERRRRGVASRDARGPERRGQHHEPEPRHIDGGGAAKACSPSLCAAVADRAAPLVRGTRVAATASSGRCVLVGRSGAPSTRRRARSFAACAAEMRCRAAAGAARRKAADGVMCGTFVRVCGDVVETFPKPSVSPRPPRRRAAPRDRTAASAADPAAAAPRPRSSKRTARRTRGRAFRTASSRARRP